MLLIESTRTCVAILARTSREWEKKGRVEKECSKKRVGGCK